MSPKSFRVYNTLSRQVEAFVPLVEGQVGLYVCGMTVYDHAHVGHARAMVVFDAFVRWLRHEGWQVTFVRNFTDVDDKIITRAQQRGVGALELAEQFIQDFHADCASLGLEPPTHEPRVSTSMPAIQAMIGELITKGHAYEAGGSVWFKVGSCADYGCLSGQDPAHMCASADADNQGTKADARDFALWKAAKAGEPAWPSPWGEGRPGWHIECSAMIREHLGVTVDIHGGGLDLVFPHHENELAQSTCANDAPYVRTWMHNGLLTLVRNTEDGQVLDAKMGKSAGNVVNIRTAVQGYPAEALKVFYLAAHYRSPLPWTETSLDEALGMLARLYEAREVAEGLQGEEAVEVIAAELGPDAQELLDQARAFPARFAEALNDDFHTARALSLAFELARAINRFANHKQARRRGGALARLALQALSRLEVLGLLQLSTEAFQAEVKLKRLGALGLSVERVEALLAERTAARLNKDWARSDALRAELDASHIVVMDRPEGVEWRVKVA